MLSEESALFTPHHQRGCRKGAREVFINHTSLFVRLPLLPCLYRRFSLSAEGMHGGYGEAESPTERCCGVISPMWCSLWDQTQRVSLGAVMVNQPSISYIRRLLFCCFFLHALPFFFFPLSLLQLVEATALPLPVQHALYSHFVTKAFTVSLVPWLPWPDCIKLSLLIVFFFFKAS